MGLATWRPSRPAYEPRKYGCGDLLAVFPYRAYASLVEEDMRFRALPSLAVACLCFFGSGRQGYSQQLDSESLSPSQVQESTPRGERVRPARSARITSAHKTIAERHAAGTNHNQGHNSNHPRKELSAGEHVQRCVAD